MNTTDTFTIADILAQIESMMTAAKKAELHLILNRIITRIEDRAFDTDCGYCTVFFIPSTPVLNLYAFLELNKDDVASAFQSDWQYGTNTQMYGSAFYHVLLLLVGWGIEQKDVIISEKALFLILVKLWNGRKRKFIRYCNAGTMLATIENLVRPNSLLKKFDSPTLLIKNHYIPSLIKTYSSHVIKDASIGLKKIFSQSWNRLDQIFAHKYELDAENNKKIAKYGLLPLYLQAKEQGYRNKSTAIDISSLNIVDNTSRDNLYRSVLKDIQRSNNPGICELTLMRMNSTPDPSYQENFLEFLHAETKVSRRVITIIIKALHKTGHKDVVEFILRYLFKRIDKRCLRGKDIQREMNRVIFTRRNDVHSQKIKETMEKLITKEMTIYNEAKQYKTSQMNRLRKVVFYVCTLNLCLAYANYNDKHSIINLLHKA